jgi:Raf kinase inhibitor-like YbhB/YbcL family protein
MSSRSKPDLAIRAVALAGCLGVLMALAACSSTPAASSTPTPKASKTMTSTDNPYTHLPKVSSFTVVSSTVKEGQPLPTAQLSGVFGAGGKDISPQLSWSGFPAETKSFVVTMYDPEAPTGSGFWHWVVADIPATTTSLPEDAGASDSKTLPAGAVQLGGDAGMNRYIGGAPPAGSGVHDYYITVTALDEATSGLDANASGAFLGFNIAGHTIARATLVCPTSAS